MIPVDSNKQRIIITVGIKATRSVILGLVVFDPRNQNSHYMRRKLHLGESAYREVLLPLPITPAQVVVDIYNKSTHGDEGFAVEKFEVAELEEKEIWAIPERHRFMSFAIEFATRAGHAAPGFYPSKNYEFLIHYLPSIRDDDGKELVTPARVHRHMPRVQISQRLFKQFSIPVRVAILSHEGCHYFNNTRSEREADLCGIKYYLDYGFPKIEAIYAATQVFLTHPETVNEVHMKRTKDIDDFVSNYKQKGGNN